MVHCPSYKPTFAADGIVSVKGKQMNPFTVYMCVDGTLSLELNEVI
jgi:hypothetical protein